MAPPPHLKTILIEHLSEGAVLFSYNTPKRSNAFDPQQYLDLRDGLVWARDEDAIRVVVVYALSNFMPTVFFPSPISQTAK